MPQNDSESQHEKRPSPTRSDKTKHTNSFHSVGCIFVRNRNQQRIVSNRAAEMKAGNHACNLLLSDCRVNDTTSHTLQTTRTPLCATINKLRTHDDCVNFHILFSSITNAFSIFAYFSQIGCSSSKQVQEGRGEPDCVESEPDKPAVESSTRRFSSASSSLSVVRRLMAELGEIRRGPDPFRIAPNDDCITHWEASIDGPHETPYSGGLFKIDIAFPMEYPFSPPRVTFRTTIFHPNVSSTGAICLDLLKVGSGSWSPVITAPDLLRSIQSLLSDPNPDDPLNVEAADLYVHHRTEFNKRAVRYTSNYALTKEVTIEAGEDPHSFFQLTRDGRVIDEDDALNQVIQSSVVHR